MESSSYQPITLSGTSGGTALELVPLLPNLDYEKFNHYWQAALIIGIAYLAALIYIYFFTLAIYNIY